MARYQIQLYGVPDQHKYDALHRKVWRAFMGVSWQVRLALLSTGSGLGLLLQTFILGGL
jgi:hypothetical protein